MTDNQLDWLTVSVVAVVVLLLSAFAAAGLATPREDPIHAGSTSTPVIFEGPR